METMNQTLVAAREAAGLAQWQLAEALGVTRPMVQKWERGDPVAQERIPELARLLKLDPWLIEIAQGRIPGEMRGLDPQKIWRTLRRLHRRASVMGAPE